MCFTVGSELAVPMSGSYHLQSGGLPALPQKQYKIVIKNDFKTML